MRKPSPKAHVLSSTLLPIAVLTGFVPSLATAATWTQTAGGVYNWDATSPSNWDTTFPNAVGATANITQDFTGPQTINLNQPITVGSLAINDTGGSSDSAISIAAGTAGNLTMQVSAGNASISNSTTGATNVISANIAFNSNTDLSTAGGVTSTVLQLSGSLSGNTTLTRKAAIGTLQVSGNNSNFTGSWVLDGGSSASITRFDSDGAIGASNVGLTVKSNGSLQLVTGVSIGSGRSFVVNSGATLGLNPSSNLSNTTLAANISGAGSLTRTSLNTSAIVILSGNNTYSGTTNVAGGTLRAGSTTAFSGNSTVTLTNGSNATLDLNGFSNSVGSLAGGGSSGGNVTLGSATLTTGGNNTSTTFAGVISGVNGGLTKIGTGTQTLTGANTYTGATTVNAGTLIVGVSGTGSLTSAVTVNAGTLGGSGSTTGAITIGDGAGVADAIIAPGNSVGILTTTSSLSLLSDAKFAFELDGTSAVADELVANGASIASGALFEFTLLGDVSGLSVGQSFTLIDNTSLANISGTFANLTAGGSYDAGNGLTFAVSGTGGDYGNDLVLTVASVPEPSTFTALMAGLGALAILRRRTC